ncbi:SpaH/EbpB family LPXTG-anchored major pilin [Enterococcus sp. LJL98]
MRTGRKIWKIIVASLLIVPLFVGGLSAFAVDEAPTTAAVTVHKRVFQDKIPEGYPKQNTGSEMNDFGGDPLAGAEFTVYDVTTKYHAALAVPGATQTSAMDAVIAQYPGAPGTFTPLQAHETVAGTGTAVFAGLPLKSGGKDAAYLFVETKTPDSPTIIQTAAPFILAMPIYTAAGADGQLNTDIHVYPKNVKADNKKEMTNVDAFDSVTVNGVAHPNVQIGDTLSYQLTIHIPADIDKKATFEILDRPGAGMAVANPVNVVVTGLTLDDDYELDISSDRDALDISLDTSSEAVKALAGKTLIITYDMVLTAEAIPDTVIDNHASIKVNGETTIDMTPPPGVVTGGKQFIKRDAHTEKALEGAKFKVSQGSNWAKFTLNSKGEYAFNGWGTEAEATEITSATTTGSIKVIGLTQGNYQLKETVAPNGYVLLAEPVDFEVVYEQYADEEYIDIVGNVPKGLLPSTGGTGIYSFLIIGAMMMAGAYIWFKRSKEQAEV